jgi:hypothetical protein
MKISTKTINTILILAGVFFISFIVLGILEVSGDLAGWVQSAIAVIEIPIIIYGFAKVVDEIRTKPELDYGFLIPPINLEDYEDKPIAKILKLNTLDIHEPIVFVLMNKGKLTAEKIDVNIYYDDIDDLCSPIVWDPKNPQTKSSQLPKVLFSYFRNLIEILTPGNHNYFYLYLRENESLPCQEYYNKPFRIGFSIKIYFKDSQSPIQDSIFIEYNPSPQH